MPGICRVFFSGLARGPGFWGEDHRSEVPSAHPIRVHSVSVTGPLLTRLRGGRQVSLW